MSTEKKFPIAAIRIDMPMLLFPEFLQVLRDFEQKHKDDLITVLVSTDTAGLIEMEEAMKTMKPPPDFVGVYKRKEPH